MKQSATSLLEFGGNNGEARFAKGDTSRQQRRTLQNRKNQRERRRRVKEKNLGPVQVSRPFQVSRCRLDEFGQNESTALTPRIIQATDRPITPPPFTFPLSTDHLIHLVQYNVFRAFVSNKRTLNTLLTGWTDKPPSPTTCPLSGPYRDDTMVYPLNPNIPPSLAPTRLQQTNMHYIWVNLFPFPRIRDNLIMSQGLFDHWELLQDLIGELLGNIPTKERCGLPHAITVSNPKSRCDEDGVMADRKGLVVWGEPHDMRSWEATPGFLYKWSWAVEGCHDLIESTNRWRATRGEEPLRLLSPQL
ncbi:hypothetical protein F53441_8566 [Fusarium austroafricanum]|uniref:BZIP domain-containing protein n=1 Tax=Fusarium austroafricanum TaxID=2364996 RepID=A0A8H4NUB6_9HYPO|nr:hypothetical protein F53441_8566 [Fusarium austroafricanum]